MNNAMIQLRAVILEDAELIFQWRNHPDTRKYFFNPAELSWENHLNWLKETLASNKKLILIAESLKNPIGIIRFDKIEEGRYEIDIYLNPQLHGQGWGTQILKAGLQKVKAVFPEAKTIVAKVVPENIASHRIFIKTGFDHLYNQYEFQL